MMIKKYNEFISENINNSNDLFPESWKEKLDITDVVAHIQKLRGKYQMDIHESTERGGDIVYMLPKGLCCGVSHEY